MSTPEENWQYLLNMAQQKNIPPNDTQAVTKFGLSTLANTFLGTCSPEWTKDYVDGKMKEFRELVEQQIIKIKRTIQNMPSSAKSNDAPMEDFKDYTNLPYKNMPQDEPSYPSKFFDEPERKEKKKKKEKKEKDVKKKRKKRSRMKS
jgi:hypothetical protein